MILRPVSELKFYSSLLLSLPNGKYQHTSPTLTLISAYQARLLLEPIVLAVFAKKFFATSMYSPIAVLRTLSNKTKLLALDKEQILSQQRL
jgi:hypothetical protein